MGRQVGYTMLNPEKVALFIPPGLAGFKQRLFERVGGRVGRVVRHSFSELEALPDEVIPFVGCTPELRPVISSWRSRGRVWGYWDRGYMRRVFATDLPRGDDGGYYRWHVGSFQMERMTQEPPDRWEKMRIALWPWSRGGGHVVVAEPSPTYERFHGISGWTERTVAALRVLTDRPIVIRDKEMQRRASDRMANGRFLHEDLKGAHALVTHGSIAAVESVIMGCPVFVDGSSAAALVGLTDLEEIEAPVYPDREAWVKALCYSQFNERELVDGTLWRTIQ